jgi:peptidoglycan/LPS O-acetylase OafA/YrhL
MTNATADRTLGTSAIVSERSSASHIRALDGLRGIAAVAVVLYHSRLGDRLGVFTHGWLAVDFFLCLSGYVIGLAYDKRMAAGMSASAFAKVRVLRLYPMVLIGGLIGIVMFPWVPQFGYCLSGHPDRAIPAMASQLLMVPMVVGPCIYTYNGVFWSLFFELLANAVHFAILWRCSTRSLGVLLIVLIAVVGGFGLTEGWIYFGVWPSLFWQGLPRCLLSYVVGYTLFRTRERWMPLLPVLPFTSIAFVLFVALVAPPLAGALPSVGSARFVTIGQEMAMVVLLFPLVVALGVVSRIKGRWPLMLGVASYPLYATHVPFVLAITAGFVQWPPLAFIAVRLAGIAGVIVVAWLLAVTIDLPLNRLRRGSSASAVAAS